MWLTYATEYIVYTNFTDFSLNLRKVSIQPIDSTATYGPFVYSYR